VAPRPRPRPRPESTETRSEISRYFGTYQAISGNLGAPLGRSASSACNAFRQGGPAGYGLRRLLVDESRNPKGELERGDLQTDRVVLVPGPEEEIEYVQAIYLMFVEDGKSERENRHDHNR
jgi:hypothetical protein